MSTRRAAITHHRALLLILACAGVGGCERPSPHTQQQGYRGTGMVDIQNPGTLASRQLSNVVPVALPASSPGGPPASVVFQNVKVLGDVSVGEFTRTMLAITAWVAPKEGCNYCHDAANLASDTKYTKVVSRRMLEMTRHINSSWTTHVATTGVTCYTCHRGNPVPAQIWFDHPESVKATFAGNKGGQNMPTAAVGLTSLPYDPFSTFLVGDTNIRTVSASALPTGDKHSIKQTEWTYALMIHMSQSLGVNCTYCHNSRSFTDWDQSRPQRVTAWYGIRMVRDLNDGYLGPLASTFPPQRLGPGGDGPKLSCATCHQGAFKPLLGAKMLVDYPALAAPAAAAVPAQPAVEPPATEAVPAAAGSADGSTAALQR
jgi:photosynthetic reaction center cytochrome c subunit